MRELRTQEGVKFERFFSLVRKAAKEKGCIFFVDCGEGRELFIDEMEGEDLSGWLIPEEYADEFQAEFDTDEVSEKWNDYVMFAIWNQNAEGITIEFEIY